MKIIKFIIFSILVSISFLLASCYKKQKLPERIISYLQNNSNEILKIGLYQEPSSLNPFLITYDFASVINNLIFASPLVEDDNGNFQPFLFENFVSYTDENNHFIVDGIWKQNLKWHDGTEFNPADLEFTLQIISNSITDSPYSKLAQNIVSIQNLDRGRRTRIVFKQNSRQLLKLLTLGILPSHRFINKNQSLSNLKHEVPSYFNREDLDLLIEKSYFQAQNLEDNKKIIQFSAVPVSLGPYKIVGRLPYKFIELEKFQDSPINTNFQKIIFKIYSRVDELISSFRKGEVDVVYVPEEVSKKISEFKFQNVFYKVLPNSTYLVWGFNLSKQPFDNLEFRQILSRIVDRKKIIFNLGLNAKEIFNLSLANFNNEYTINTPTTNIVSDSNTSSSVISLHQYDQTEHNKQEYINQTLAKIGFSDTNNDGWLEFNNQPFEIKIFTNHENLLRKMACEIIAENLKKYKIKSNIETFSWADLIETISSSSCFETFLIAFFIPPDKNVINLFHSNPPFDMSFNLMKFSNQRLDQLLNTYNEYSIDSPNQNEILKSIEFEINNNMPVCWLAQMYDLIGIYNNCISNISERLPFSSQRIYLWSKHLPQNQVKSAN